MGATTKEWPGRPRASLVAALALFATVLALGLAALAQDGDQATVPGKLRVEVSEDGVVLSWEAPASDAEAVTGYEIQVQYVRSGVGIVQVLAGNTDAGTITWTDLMATATDTYFVYRVRALRAEVPSQWSSFVITDRDLPVAPSAAPQELVPTEVVAVAPVEPTAVVEFEPTSVPPVTPAAPLPDPGQAEEAPAAPVVPAAPVGPTTAPPEPEPTVAAPVAQAPPAPLPESSNELNVSQPVVVIEPEIEPEVELISEQQQAEEEPAPPVAPTAVPPEPEPTTAAPVAPVKLQEPEQQQPIETVPEVVVTEEEPAPPPAPTAVPPEPKPTTAAPVAPVKLQEPEQQQPIETVPEVVVTEEEPAPPPAPTAVPPEPEPNHGRSCGACEATRAGAGAGA